MSARRTRSRLGGGQGFTLVEVLISLAIVLALSALLLVVVNQARARGRAAVCLSNIRNINAGILAYSNDYDGTLPPVAGGVIVRGRFQAIQSWHQIIQPHIKIPQCPDTVIPPFLQYPGLHLSVSGYAYNHNFSRRVFIEPTKALSVDEGQHEGVVSHPALTVSVFDARPGIESLTCPDTITRPPIPGVHSRQFIHEILALKPAAYRHSRGGANYGFLDGHVKWMRPEQIDTTKKHEGERPGFGL